MNFPGKYRKMNSGKYLYKTSKKPLPAKDKTLMYFDDNIIKYISKFLDRLSELECKFALKIDEKISKKKRNIENVSLKLFSDDTLNPKIPCNYHLILGKPIKESGPHQGPIIDSKHIMDKSDYSIMVNNSNIYYNFGLNIFPNSSLFNEVNKQNYNQINPMFLKGYDPSKNDV